MPYSPGIIFRLLAFCMLAGLSPPAAAASEPASYTVKMERMRYGAIPDGLKVGDTITWVNLDNVLHTVTARDRSFDIRIPPRKKVRMTLKKAGEFAFYCVLHPAMRGELSVAAN